ncbi:MAG: hypothetical protein PHR23_01155 [bacterium]|nr:hypothetical protein [bacterium]
MKKKIQSLLIVAALLTLSWKTAGADSPTGLFLLVPQGARAEAMGKAVVSNCLDYSALYWNPAAAAFVPGFTVGADRVNLFPDADNGGMPNTFFALILPIGKYSFGCRFINQTAELETYDNNGYSTGINEAECSRSFGLSAANQILPNLAMGTTLNYNHMRLLANTKTIFSLDAGLLYKSGRFNAALTLATLGQQVKFTEQGPLESLPLINRLGLSYYLLSKKNLLCSVSYERIWNQQDAGGASFGIEYYPLKNFALRSGIERRNDRTIAYFMGIGLSFARFNLDYAATSALNGNDDYSISNESRFGFSYTR